MNCLSEIHQELIQIASTILKINERTASNVVKNSVIFSSIFITIISLIVIRYFYKYNHLEIDSKGFDI